MVVLGAYKVLLGQPHCRTLKCSNMVSFRALKCFNRAMESICWVLCMEWGWLILLAELISKKLKRQQKHRHNGLLMKALFNFKNSYRSRTIGYKDLEFSGLKHLVIVILFHLIFKAFVIHKLF